MIKTGTLFSANEWGNERARLTNGKQGVMGIKSLIVFLYFQKEYVVGTLRMGPLR